VVFASKLSYSKITPFYFLSYFFFVVTFLLMLHLFILRSATDVSNLTNVALLCAALTNLEVELHTDFIPGRETTLADAVSRVRL